MFLADNYSNFNLMIIFLVCVRWIIKKNFFSENARYFLFWFLKHFQFLNVNLIKVVFKFSLYNTSSGVIKSKIVGSSKVMLNAKYSNTKIFREGKDCWLFGSKDLVLGGWSNRTRMLLSEGWEGRGDLSGKLTRGRVV